MGLLSFSLDLRKSAERPAEGTRSILPAPSAGDEQIAPPADGALRLNNPIFGVSAVGVDDHLRAGHSGYPSFSYRDNGTVFAMPQLVQALAVSLNVPRASVQV